MPHENGRRLAEPALAGVRFVAPPDVVELDRRVGPTQTRCSQWTPDDEDYQAAIEEWQDGVRNDPQKRKLMDDWLQGGGYRRYNPSSPMYNRSYEAAFDGMLGDAPVARRTVYRGFGNPFDPPMDDKFKDLWRGLEEGDVVTLAKHSSTSQKQDVAAKFAGRAAGADPDDFEGFIIEIRSRSAVDIDRTLWWDEGKGIPVTNEKLAELDMAQWECIQRKGSRLRYLGREQITAKRGHGDEPIRVWKLMFEEEYP